MVHQIAMPVLHELIGASTYVFILAIVKFTREAFQSYTGCMRGPSHLLLLWATSRPRPRPCRAAAGWPTSACWRANLQQHDGHLPDNWTTGHYVTSSDLLRYWRYVRWSVSAIMKWYTKAIVEYCFIWLCSMITILKSYLQLEYKWYKIIFRWKLIRHAENSSWLYHCS